MKIIILSILTFLTLITLWEVFITPIKLKHPTRNLKQALHYWHPKRLTVQQNLPIHAWLWWNF